jgi:hypothetical protein
LKFEEVKRREKKRREEKRRQVRKIIDILEKSKKKSGDLIEMLQRGLIISMMLRRERLQNSRRKRVKCSFYFISWTKWRGRVSFPSC